MIKGIGVDFVTVDRFSSLSDHQLKRMFAPSEVERANLLEGKGREEFLASRFAAKEAFAKAFGTGIRGFSLPDVEVLSDDVGKPYLGFSSKLEQMTKGFKFHLSISHEKGMAIAMVVCDEI